MGSKYSFADAKNCDINFKDSRMNHKKELTSKSERTHMQQKNSIMASKLFFIPASKVTT